MHWVSMVIIWPSKPNIYIYICGIRNIVIRNSEQLKPVLNRGMNFVYTADTAETQSQADAWYRGTRVTSAWQWPSDAMNNTCFWDYLYLLCSTSSRLQMSCRIPLCSRVIYSVGNELLLYWLLRNPAAIDVYNLGQLPIASYSTIQLGYHTIKNA